MRIILAQGPGDSGVLRVLEEGTTIRTDTLAATVADLERAHQPRWIWADSAVSYRRLIRSGVRVRQCYDLGLAARAVAGLHGRDHAAPAPAPVDNHRAQPQLFGDPGDTEPDLESAVRRYQDQRALVATAPPPAYEPVPVHPARVELLLAADSAGALAAAEMSETGLPWRDDIHDRILTKLLGERPRIGGRPPVLADLANRIAGLLGRDRVNPDSPAELIAAFGRAGVALASTRAYELRKLDHPAVAPLLEYKALSRLHTANGWAWARSWVHDGRFRPEYLPAAVVSGRWATRGGGALQIPRAVRPAAVADPGWTLVVADARQLEPRILAAISRDSGMVAAAQHEDLYAALADASFGGDRGKAKVGLLSAMYGGTSAALATLRTSYPDATAVLEHAARVGESGGMVRSVLGRTSPPAGAAWDGLTEAQVLRRSRDYGRFTRNFAIQASAADWAAAVLASLRLALAGGPSELVFFCHDEIVVHCPVADAPAVAAAVQQAGAAATALLFGPTDVPFGWSVATVSDYGSAKAG